MKAPTGIIGFDEISGGRLLRGRTTLLVGGPGSGETTFAMALLMRATESREKALTRGRIRMGELLGDDAAAEKRK